MYMYTAALERSVLDCFCDATRRTVLFTFGHRVTIRTVRLVRSGSLRMSARVIPRDAIVTLLINLRAISQLSRIISRVSTTFP